jgi:hypothetical protein
MSVPTHWLRGGWYPRGIIVHHRGIDPVPSWNNSPPQRYRPSDGNTNVDISNILNTISLSNISAMSVPDVIPE